MKNKYFMDNISNLKLFGLWYLKDRVENESCILDVRKICSILIMVFLKGYLIWNIIILEFFKE